MHDIAKLASGILVIKIRLSAIDADEFMSQEAHKKLLIILHRKQSLFIRGWSATTLID